MYVRILTIRQGRMYMVGDITEGTMANRSHNDRLDEFTFSHYYGTP